MNVHMDSCLIVNRLCIHYKVYKIILRDWDAYKNRSLYESLYGYQTHGDEVLRNERQ